MTILPQMTALVISNIEPGVSDCVRTVVGAPGEDSVATARAFDPSDRYIHGGHADPRYSPGILFLSLFLPGKHRAALVPAGRSAQTKPTARDSRIALTRDKTHEDFVNFTLSALNTHPATIVISTFHFFPQRLF